MSSLPLPYYCQTCLCPHPGLARRTGGYAIKNTSTRGRTYGEQRDDSHHLTRTRSAAFARPAARAPLAATPRPMLQLARKVFDDSIIVRPWRKPATRWLASVSDALRRNPATGIAGCCALRERPRGRRAAEQRDELAALHSITSSARASRAVSADFWVAT